MSPQPLSSYLKRIPHPKLDLTPDRIEERPALAILVAKAIAISAVIETQWGRLLAGVLGPGAAPTIAAYLALSGGNAQRAALEAAVGKALTAENKEIFDALASIARPLAKMRNKLVHGGWGICHDLPDALLLQETEPVIWLHHEVDKYIRVVMDLSPNARKCVPEPADDLKSILVFKEQDLVDLNRMLSRLRGFLATFTNLVSQQKILRGSIGGHLFQMLLAEPEIAEVLARQRQRQKKTPISPRRGPQKGRRGKS
jgi:hypothetical protein